MIEGKLSPSFFARSSDGEPRIEVEVLKMPDGRAVPQDGRVRLSTETGFWRFESAKFDGAGSYEVIATVTLKRQRDFRRIALECYSKADAYRRIIDADRKERGVENIPRIAPNEQSLSKAKSRLYALQKQFADAYFNTAPPNLDAAYNVVIDTLDVLDPILPAFPDESELQNFRAYAFKNYAMVMRDRGNQPEFSRALDQAEQMFAAIREQAPRDASAWNGLGSVALLRNDPASALQYIDRALELEPAYYEAIEDRKTALKMLEMQTTRR